MSDLYVFADVSNLYHCIGLKWDNRKINYNALLKFIIEKWGKPKKAFAFGAQMKNEAMPFIHCLKKIGWTPQYKTPKKFGDAKVKADWDVGIAIKMVQAALDGCKTMVLCSADGDMSSAVRWLQNDMDVQVYVIGCGISYELMNIAIWFEITQDLLEAAE